MARRSTVGAENASEGGDTPAALVVPSADGELPGGSVTPEAAAQTPPPAVRAESDAISDGSSLSERRIGIIGAGAMGSALCKGLIASHAAPANRVVVSDADAAHAQNLQKTLGVKVADTNVQVAKHADIILLAVKPYLVAAVLDEIHEALSRDDSKPLPVLISIAAGVPIAKIEARLKSPIPVIRAMPNTPALVNLGACAYCRGTHADAIHTAQAAEIFRSVGIAVEVPESLIDAVTGVSGSGPAYVYLIIEALVDGGVKVGLPRDIARQLAVQTVLGAAQMVLTTGMHPAQLKDMVTTPAGTTIAGLASLEQSGVRAALIDAVEAATKRSRELA